MKKLIIVLLFLCVGYVSNAQNYASSVGINAGYSQKGVGVLVNYNYFVDRFSAFQAGLFASFSQDEFKGEKIPFSLISFQGGYSRIVWTNRNDRSAISLMGGGLIGYEIVNNGEEQLPSGAVVSDESKFVYGLYAGIEYDYIIKKDWSIIARVSQNYHLNSDLGNLTPYFGVGLRHFLF